MPGAITLLWHNAHQQGIEENKDTTMELVEALKDSVIWGRIAIPVLMAFSSKYTVSPAAGRRPLPLLPG